MSFERLRNLGLDELKQRAFEVRGKYFGGDIFFYRKPYTPVSFTGVECELACKHCNRHYLKHMMSFSGERGLIKLAHKLRDEQVKGLVLSGGSRLDGSVPLYDYAKILSQIKKDTSLRLNAHTGILNDNQAKGYSMFLDAALTDVIGDGDTIRQILGLKNKPSDYRNTLKLLEGYGVKNLSPHIIVGLHYGRIRGEYNALKLLEGLNLSNIVVVVFIPTQGTMMQNCNPPDVDEVARFACVAKIKYPRTHLSLSCVRPGGAYRLNLDKALVDSGVTKIALPSKAAYREAKKLGLVIEEINESRCCSW